ncbi:hypothetical protein [Herpetosiphon geysericola]|uniref:Uncharacterized protein n=1 Tax=Herpetosiphon geysericola TaxID=70996 RepID=A0A0P6YDW4_9CHLR|nr:hypothetical protein [Herpetosiphon geysericola]KPL80222.1 hypothetical protein SE18_24510 [Herpetosiphon geysericola]
MPRKQRSSKTITRVTIKPPSTPGQITISPGRTPINTEDSKPVASKSVPQVSAPLTEEQAIYRRIKLDFLGMIEKCSHVVFTTLPYLLAMLAGHFANEFYGFLAEGALEKLSEFRNYGNMVEGGLLLIGGAGIVIHNIFDLLTQAKADYDIFKKGGK